MDTTPPSVDVISLGCRLNAAEGEAMRDAAVQAGISDAVIINTCAVTAEATRQARQTIRRARRERPGARIVVTGCAVEINTKGFEAMAEVDQIIGNGEKTDPRHFTSAPSKTLGETVFERASARPAAARERARATLAVQNGCDHRCTFCVIPFGRGNARSLPVADAVAGLRALVDQGFSEVVLTGVDLTSWGTDLPSTPPLGDLIAAMLTAVPDLKRLRLSSIDAIEIDPTLMRLIAEEERLAPYLHLSLQAGDDMILKRMKRRHMRADAVRLCADVRRLRPDVAFGADLIAGFPTETEAMFENTLALVDDCGLSYLHVFPFSPRPMTPAAKMPQLPRDVIAARAARLRDAGSAALHTHLEVRVGRIEQALVEGPLRARAADFTDITLDQTASEIGQIITVRLTGHDGKRAQGVRV